MDIIKKKLKDLAPAQYNPRQISDKAYGGLKKSIERFGMVEPIIWNKQTNNVVGGHQRLRVMLEAGIEETQVVVVDLPLTEEKALNVTLNNPNITGEFDGHLQLILDDIKLELPDLYDDVMLDELSKLDPLPSKTDPDAIPDPGSARCEPGQIWKLGNHRLMCGDATDADAIASLMDGEKSRMVFTDPPWNVAIGLDSNPRHRQRAGMINDALSPEDYKKFIMGFAVHLLKYNNGDVYIILGAKEWPTLDLCLRDIGFHWSASIIWVKDLFVLGRSKYHRRYEPIWYGWQSGKKSSYSADRKQDDVWEIDRPRVSADHPTMKPVKLCIMAIENSSLKNNIVLDCFMGSGATIIACEQILRRCFGMEIDPRYCDVSIKRWEEFTGRQAELIV